MQDRPETAELVEWCRREPVPGMRLVIGPGGPGKTQLAAQVCRKLTDESGWLAGFVRLPAALWRASGLGDPGTGQLADPTGQWGALIAALRALPALAVPGVLMVVDYAEAEPELAS